MRILIVEDEQSLARLLCDRLKKEKYTVDVSNDGEEGLNNALSGIVCCVTSRDMCVTYSICWQYGSGRGRCNHD